VEPEEIHRGSFNESDAFKPLLPGRAIPGQSQCHIARVGFRAVAVRGGGHNGAGFGVCDRGLVIDLCSMKGVLVGDFNPQTLTSSQQDQISTEPPTIPEDF
jgi:hypothetical protein